MEEVEYSVPAIHCGHCTATIERVVGEIPGVTWVHADVTTKRVRVRFGPPATRAAIEDVMVEWGYPPER